MRQVHAVESVPHCHAGNAAALGAHPSHFQTQREPDFSFPPLVRARQRPLPARLPCLRQAHPEVRRVQKLLFGARMSLMEASRWRAWNALHL